MAGKKNMQLWFVRHGESHNNAILKAAGGLGTILYPIKHDADPYLTEKGREIAQRNGQLVKAAKINFDLILSSVMVRTMQTAYHMFITTGVADKIYLAPFISETPMSFSGIKLKENIPLPRLQQIQKLGKLDGSDILDHLDWSLIGGPKGDNEKALPPNGQMFLSWLMDQDILKEIEAAHEDDDEYIKIAVVTHSHFLKGDTIKLGFKPDNVDIWTAVLHRMDPGDGTEDILTFTDIEGWYQEKVNVKRQEIEKDIDYNSKKRHVKEKKYKGKIEANKETIDILTDSNPDARLENEDDIKKLKKSKKKIEKYNKKIVKKNEKYGSRLEQLQEQKAKYANPSDIAIEAAKEGDVDA